MNIGFMRLVVAAMVLVMFSGCAQAGSSKPKDDTAQSKQDVKLEKLEIVGADGNTHMFDVELATTPHTMAYGLMDRYSMPDDRGMLFVFTENKLRSFWMRNTYISLDMIFISPDGKVVHIHPEAIPLDETLISSQVPAQYVLELNGGVAQKLNIQVGDKINQRIFGNKLAH